MARQVRLTEPSIGNWAATDELMIESFFEGTFEPTVAVIDWPESPGSISIGIHEDGDMLNADLARDRGYHVGRRVGYGGSVGVYGPNIPLFTLWFDAGDRDLSLDSLSRISGEATVDAIERFEVTANYDHIGDVEVVTEENSFKVAANAPVQFHETDLWAITVSIIWGGPPEGIQELLDATVQVPPEKFEDKDEKTVTGRMSPLSTQLERFGSDVTKDEFVEAVVEENVRALLGPDEPVESGSFDADERDAIRDLTPFFESDAWIDRVATSRLCKQWPADARVGVAAYKSRKLVKASVIVDEDDVIQAALITGDFFVRPHPSVTDRGAPRDLEAAVVGIDATDERALTEAISTVFDRPGFEMPEVAPEDVAAPIVRAAGTTMAVGEYLDDYA